MSTAVVAPRVPVGAVAVLAAGCAVLALRPVLLDAAGSARAVPMAVAVFAALLLIGIALPVAPDARASRATAITVLGFGVAAFAAGRVLAGGAAPHAFTARLVALNSLAAVAEEAFFRRLAYGALARHGTTFAVAGSAALFAIVHVTVYGWWALPLDAAAGLLLSWQRAATGRWTVPAATHVIANVLVVL